MLLVVFEKTIFFKIFSTNSYQKNSLVIANQKETWFRERTAVKKSSMIGGEKESMRLAGRALTCAESEKASAHKPILSDNREKGANGFDQGGFKR